jgi:ferredoxin
MSNINIIFSDNDGNEQELSCRAGTTILEIAREHDLPLEAECEGMLSCSTCHVVVDEKYFPKLPSIGRDESDLLATARNPTCTSRLGCQVRIDASLEGMRISMPEA